jgi:flagellar basal-body rod modification protein FlgD
MSTVASTLATSSSGMTASDTGTQRVATKELGQDDFLKLLTVQLSQQDPMNPVSDTDFIAQMAQFSSLSQTNKLVSEMGFMRADAQMQAATNLIGKQVTLDLGDDGTVVGPVDSIEADNSTIYVNVNGGRYEYARVIGVEAIPVTPVPTETDSTTS